jgi:hypothetical protein
MQAILARAAVMRAARHGMIRLGALPPNWSIGEESPEKWFVR